MPTTRPVPPFLKGAIVALDPAPNSSPITIAFQYNPQRVSRTLTPKQPGGEQDKPNENRLDYAPSEKFTLSDVMIDVADQLERGDANAQEVGIYPQLAALETLLYPTSQRVTSANKLWDQGQVEIAHIVPLLTLFVWGPKRVVPVQLTSLTVEEQIFDTQLNPVRAKVALEMRALTYADFSRNDKGFSLFLAYHKGKEQLAARGVTSDPNKALGFNVRGHIR
jgi:hypothetical protein